MAVGWEHRGRGWEHEGEGLIVGWVLGWSVSDP